MLRKRLTVGGASTTVEQRPSEMKPRLHSENQARAFGILRWTLLNFLLLLSARVNAGTPGDALTACTNVLRIAIEMDEVEMQALRAPALVFAAWSSVPSPSLHNRDISREAPSICDLVSRFWFAIGRKCSQRHSESQKCCRRPRLKRQQFRSLRRTTAPAVLSSYRLSPEASALRRRVPSSGPSSKHVSMAW